MFRVVFDTGDLSQREKLSEIKLSLPNILSESHIYCVHSRESFMHLNIITFNSKFPRKLHTCKIAQKLWWVSSTPFGLPFRLPFQFQNAGSSPFILQMTNSEGFQQHFSITSKSVCCGFYMKKNVAFTLIYFADDCFSVQMPSELSDTNSVASRARTKLTMLQSRFLMPATV